MDFKKRIMLTLCGLAALTAECLLIRFPLLSLHGTLQWPWVLLIAGAVPVAVGGLLGAKWTVIGTLAGYLISFFCGLIFDFPSSGGHGTTGPVVWTMVYLAFIALGIVLSIKAAWDKKHHS